MTKEEAKKFGLYLLQGIMERNESYPVYANNVKQAIEALSESGSSEIPNDLEEAAKNPYVLNNVSHAAFEYERTRNDLDARSDNEVVRRAFIAGAKWDRQQMMKEAVFALAKYNLENYRRK